MTVQQANNSIVHHSQSQQDPSKRQRSAPKVGKAQKNVPNTNEVLLGNSNEVRNKVSQQQIVSDHSAKSFEMLNQSLG